MAQNKMVPKILFVNQGGELYGSDAVLLEVVRSLLTSCSPVVVLGAEGPLTEKMQALGCEIHIFDLGMLRRVRSNPFGVLQTLFRIMRATAKLVRLIRRNNISLVYSNTIGLLPGAFAARLTGRPHISHIQEIILTPRVVSLLLPWLTSTLSTHVVADSQAIADFLGHGRHVNNITVVHNSLAPEVFDNVDTGAIRREFGVPDQKFMIGVVGRIHYWKGQDFFLNAAYVLKKDGYADFLSLIVGAPFPGYEWFLDQLKDQTSRLGLSEQVRFCGYRRDIPEIMSSIDVLVCPSTRPEPFGLVILEGMAARKPVIATAMGGPLEIIDDGATGFLVRPDSPQELAQRLLELAHNPDLRIKMGLNGRKRLEELFSLEVFTQNIQGVVNGVLNTR